MAINYGVFFDAVRVNPFPGSLTQEQVEGMEFILDVWQDQYETVDLRHLAYPLATAFHETGATMLPISEWGEGRGMSYGEEDPETQQRYFGRGFRTVDVA